MSERGVAYRCSICLEVFERVYSDEVARAEFEAMFPGESIETSEITCDVCWRVALGLPPASTAVPAVSPGRDPT